MAYRRKSFLKRDEKREIFYKLLNSFLGGLLVFLGAFMDGQLTQIEIIASLGASLIIAVTKFKEYWDGEEGQYVHNFANFF